MVCSVSTLLSRRALPAADVVEGATLGRDALGRGLGGAGVAEVDVDDDPAMLALRAGARGAGVEDDAGVTDCRLLMVEARGAVLEGTMLEGREAFALGWEMMRATLKCRTKRPCKGAQVK